MELGLLAVALAADATAAAAGIGAATRSPRRTAGAAVLFGVFQAGMAALGAWGGAAITDAAAAWDHWVVFGLLTAIGARTLWEGWTGAETEAGERAWGARAMLLLAFATSVDALAAGMTLPLLGHPVVVASLTIGAVTAILSFVGGELGRRLGDRFGPRVEMAGGIVLIAIGARVLVEHLARGA